MNTPTNKHVRGRRVSINKQNKCENKKKEVMITKVSSLFSVTCKRTKKEAGLKRDIISWGEGSGGGKRNEKK